MPFTETDLAYLAGIIDGEGSFVARAQLDSRRGTFNCSVRISVVSTDKVLIDWLISRFGGRAYAGTKAKAHWRDKWQWYIGLKKAVELVPQFRRFLVIKGRQADLTMEFAALARTTHPGVRADPRRLAIVTEIRSANRRAA